MDALVAMVESERLLLTAAGAGLTGGAVAIVV